MGTLNAGEPHGDASSTDFALVAESRVEKLLDRHGLASTKVPSTFRLTALLVAMAYLPPFFWALANGTAFEGHGEGSFFGCFGFQLRALIAIPAFVLAGVTFDEAVHLVTARVRAYSILPDDAIARVADAVRRVRQVRDSTRLFVLVFIVAAFVYVFATRLDVTDLQLAWGRVEGPHPRLGIGALYYVLVVRPFVTLLLLIWVFRIGLLTYFLSRLSQLDLRLAPTHPDGAGGLGFLTLIPMSLAPVVFGFSALVAAHLANGVLYHAMTLPAFARAVAVVVVVSILLVTLPLLALAPLLVRTRAQGLAAYGAFVARRARLVEYRWLHGTDTRDDPSTEAALEAHELGSEVDLAGLYDAVSRMRPVPVTKSAIVVTVVAALLPMLPLALTRVPLRTLIEPLLGVL